MLDRARELEASGLDGIWLAERLFAADAGMPAAWPLAAALAVRTKRLRIGVGPLALPLLHPLRLAEDAATVDGLSAGRLDLAVGLGDDRGAYDVFDVDPEQRVARFADGVALLSAALAMRPIEVASPHHDVVGIDVHPKPVAELPLWIAADGAVAARRVARLGARLLCRDLDVAQAFLDAASVHDLAPREIGLVVAPDASDAELTACAARAASLCPRPAGLAWLLSVSDSDATSSALLLARARALRAITGAATVDLSGSPSSD